MNALNLSQFWTPHSLMIRDAHMCSERLPLVVFQSRYFSPINVICAYYIPSLNSRCKKCLTEALFCKCVCVFWIANIIFIINGVCIFSFLSNCLSNLKCFFSMFAAPVTVAFSHYFINVPKTNHNLSECVSRTSWQISIRLRERVLNGAHMWRSTQLNAKQSTFLFFIAATHTYSTMKAIERDRTNITKQNTANKKQQKTREMEKSFIWITYHFMFSNKKNIHTRRTAHSN